MSCLKLRNLVRALQPHPGMSESAIKDLITITCATSSFLVNMINDKVLARIDDSTMELDDKTSKTVAAKVRKERQRTAKQDRGVVFESEPDYNESNSEIRQSEKAKRDIKKTQRAIDSYDDQEQTNITYTIQKFEQLTQVDITSEDRFPTRNEMEKIYSQLYLYARTYAVLIAPLEDAIKIKMCYPSELEDPKEKAERAKTAIYRITTTSIPTSNTIMQNMVSPYHTSQDGYKLLYVLLCMVLPFMLHAKNGWAPAWQKADNPTLYMTKLSQQARDLMRTGHQTYTLIDYAQEMLY